MGGSVIKETQNIPPEVDEVLITHPVDCLSSLSLDCGVLTLDMMVDITCIQQCIFEELLPYMIFSILYYSILPLQLVSDINILYYNWPKLMVPIYL